MSNFYNITPSKKVISIAIEKGIKDIIQSIVNKIKNISCCNVPQISLLSFNIFFDGPLFKVRFEEMLIIVQKIDIQILCLQEVLLWSDGDNLLPAIKKLLKEYGYEYVYPTSNSEKRIYGLVTASKKPFIMNNKISFEDTNMGREFHHIQIKKQQDTNYNIINTHLESTFPMQSKRNKQLNQIKKYIYQKKISDRVIVCGDFNMIFKEIFQFKKFLKPQVDFITWYGKRFHNTNRSYRFDRIYTGPKIKNTKVEKILNEPINFGLDDLYISDHDGLLLNFA